MNEFTRNGLGCAGPECLISDDLRSEAEVGARLDEVVKVERRLDLARHVGALIQDDHRLRRERHCA